MSSKEEKITLHDKELLKYIKSTAEEVSKWPSWKKNGTYLKLNNKPIQKEQNQSQTPKDIKK